MRSEEYFNLRNYTGYHYHEECWEPVNKCYFETIVEERLDGSWDVFLDEPFDDFENDILIKKGFQDTTTGMFLFNAKDKDDVTNKFKDWMENEIISLRNKKNSK